MLQHHFQDTDLVVGEEFDSYIDGQRKSFKVKDVAVCDNMTLQIEAEDDDGNMETFFDVPSTFLMI